MCRGVVNLGEYLNDFSGVQYRTGLKGLQLLYSNQICDGSFA